jgi:hypothetical protein
MAGVRVPSRTCAALAALLVFAGCSAEESPRGAIEPNASASPTTTTAPPTRQDIAEAAATTVVGELLRVTDAAKQAPGARDWEPDVRQYAADPAAYLAVQSVRDYAALGLRQVGESGMDVQVTAVSLDAPEGPTVTLKGCYDSRSSRVVKVATDEVVPPGTPPRYVWDVTVTKFESEPGEPWLVSNLQPRTDTPC